MFAFFLNRFGYPELVDSPDRSEVVNCAVGHAGDPKINMKRGSVLSFVGPWNKYTNFPKACACWILAHRSIANESGTI